MIQKIIDISGNTVQPYIINNNKYLIKFPERDSNSHKKDVISKFLKNLYF